jgi:hypothetical protein
MRGRRQPARMDQALPAGLAAGERYPAASMVLPLMPRSCAPLPVAETAERGRRGDGAGGNGASTIAARASLTEAEPVAAGLPAAGLAAAGSAPADLVAVGSVPAELGAAGSAQAASV